MTGFYTDNFIVCLMYYCTITIRLKDFKGYASVGDVLVAINDRVVIEIGCEEVNKIVKQLM